MNALQAALIQRFAPQQKALQGNLAASNQRATKEVPAYFREYLAKLGTPNQKGSLAGQAVGGYQDAQSHLAGGNLSPGANIISNSFGALLNTLGANTGAYEADKSRIGKLQGIQAVQQERARGSNLRQSLSDLAAQKGAFAVTESANEAAAAEKQALDVSKLNAQLAHYGSMERTARSNSRTGRTRALAEQLLGQGRLDLNKQHNAATERTARSNARTAQERVAAAKQKAGAPAVPTARAYTGREAILAVKGKYASAGWAPGQPGKTPMHQIADDARKHGVAEPILRAGADLATSGFVHPDTVRQLKALGYTIPPEWLQGP